MHRWLIVLSTFLVAAASVTAVGVAVVSGPRAWAGDAPIGHIGDTLRVDTGTYIADVTVSSVAPCDPPPGFGYMRSGVPVRVPNPFDGVTPLADAYKPRPSDAPDALDNVLVNAPNGAIVRGGVYWDAYRDPVSNVVLLDKKTGEHLAQWNL